MSTGSSTGSAESNHDTSAQDSPQPQPQRSALRRVVDLILAYIALTKPRVIELLLVAAIPAIMQANRGVIDVKIVFITLVGGWLGAASANTLNMVVDADIDKVMKRTERRPLARHAVSTKAAFVFGISLALASVVWLTVLGNSPLAAGLILLTIAFYVLVYTMVLKRRTSQNIVWGGAAGCMPVMVSWAVVTDNAAPGTAGPWWQAIVLFLVVFFWTPPHTWALAMRYKNDYKAAGVPMLPVVMSEDKVTYRIVWYTVATVIITAVLIPAAGWLYAAAAILFGIWFLALAIKLHRNVCAGATVQPLKLFILSNNYLAGVFVALAIDAAFDLPLISTYFV